MFNYNIILLLLTNMSSTLLKTKPKTKSKSKPKSKPQPKNNRRRILVFDTIIQPENLKLDSGRKCLLGLENMKRNKIYHVRISAHKVSEKNYNKIRDVMIKDENMNDMLMIMYTILCSSTITKEITNFYESSWLLLKNREEVPLTSSLFPPNTYCINAKISTPLINIQKHGYCNISMRIYQKKN